MSTSARTPATDETGIDEAVTADERWRELFSPTMLVTVFLFVAISTLQATSTPPQQEGRSRTPPELPQAVLAARRASRAPTPVPGYYWSRRLSVGADTVIDGVIHSREPRLGPSRTLVAGIPMANQPTFSLSELVSQAGSNAAIADLNLRWLDYTAEALGRDLPRDSRAELRRLYRSTFSEGERVRERLKAPGGSPASRTDEYRMRIANIAFRTLASERALFLRHPNAIAARYGPRAQNLRAMRMDSVTVTRAVKDYLSGEYLSRPISGRPMRRSQSMHRAFASGLYPGLTAVKAADPFVLCVPGTDTIVDYEAASEFVAHDDMYESRVYLASHPALGGFNDVVDDLGLETVNLYHQSVVGAIAQLEGRRMRVITRRSVRLCPGEMTVPDFTALLAGLKPDTSLNTYYHWRVLSWEYANGAAGTWSETDELDLVRRAEFTSWTAAMRDLYQTTAGPDGHYPRAYAAAYSVGDYGLDWVCQQVANAFGFRRYNDILNPTPLWWMVLGLFGRQGISPRMDNFSMTHYGCVPGNVCVFTSPPFATGAAELFAQGWGNNLDTYYNVEHSEWRDTDAKYNFAPMTFGTLTDYAFTVPGWAF